MNLSAEMFKQITDALRSDSAGARDKRTAPRVGLRAQVLILPAPGTRAMRESVRCRNLSATGVGLLHTREIPSGAEFIICLAPTGLAAPVHISCTVVHCNKTPGSDLFSIGARIMRVLSSDEAARMAAMAA
jgi:hypothetical protein